MEVAARNERPDLRSRLGQTLARLRDPNVRVMVVGEFKQGKSQLVNAIVGAPVCPVDDDVATTVPTTIRYGKEPSATMLVPAQRGSADAASANDLVRTPVPLEEVASLVSERGNPGNARGITSVDVVLPRTILAGGLALVDSPGVGGLDAVHALATLAALPTAHALLFVTDASQEFTEPEMRFIRQALRVCPNVAVVMTKIDLYPHWREVAELNRGHLDRAGIEAAALFPVSSRMREMAAQHGDSALNEDSGFPALVRYLRHDVVDRATDVVRRATAHDLRSTSEHIALSLSAELSAIERPENAPELVARLERARERSEDLRKEASRWQTTLNDGVADLLSDLEYDLRDRLRRVRRDAERAIDEGDPGAAWEQLVSWFEERIAAAVSDTFIWTDERSTWLSEQVAAHFEAEAVALPALRVDDTEGVLDPVERVDDLDPGKLSVLEKSFVTLRGTYGGVLMIGLVTSLAGLSLINPISLAAGVLLAGKAYRDDKQVRLQRRQAEAKAIVRRHIDDVLFQVGKQLKDRLRLVHRATRDHFIDVADEYHRSIADSVTAAQRAAERDVRASERRARDIRAELERVQWLSRAADKVEPAAAGPAVTTAAARNPA
ncbi:Isoniazid-inducible protein iniA [Pseudoclavibacter endophyticus]|uniref:Isoniazid-inducible protein iniA n=2 Tax=Pseudoclavibacter endophyticus TaxID=1778590 RepID=A0A6H9WPC4_9MICO|nr:Isoniazid-inducible protein iniA [Pseudoclavibacter endophyticus]